MVIEKSKLKFSLGTLGLTFLVGILLMVGTLACGKAEEEAADAAPILEEGVMSFEGTVKIVHGKYVYIPEVKGFDIIAQGSFVSGDVNALVGKEVQGQGKFDTQKPSILVADTIDIKDETGNYQNVFTRTEEVNLDEYLDLQKREEFEILENLAFDKKDDWEGKDQAKVQGTLEQDGDNFKIIVFNEDGAQSGKIIIDSISDFSQFYIKKLSLFDKYWFYLNIKDTVDWQARRGSREMFHADVVFSGIF